MGSPGVSHLYRLPSIRQFLQRMEDDILDRRSILALFPEGVDIRTLWGQLREQLSRRDFFLEEIDVGDLPADRMLLAGVGEALHLSLPAGQHQWTIEQLYQKVRVHTQVVMLTGIEHLCQERQQQWLRLLAQWAQVSQREAGAGGEIVSLIICVPALTMLDVIPGSDLMLSVRWWWQLPSHLEMRLLCQAGSAAHHHTNPASLWRECMLAALAGDDPGIIQELWEEEATRDEVTVIDRLCTVAHRRGWSREEILQVERVVAEGLPDDWARDAAPPPGLRRAWARGLLSSCPEYGVELHAGALALAGRSEAVAQRLWRGQAQYLLPLIDQTRLRLCVYLTSAYGSNWATRWSLPLSDEEKVAVQKTSLACQWGHLEYLIRTYIPLQRERRLLTLIAQCRAVRNDIAHYRPITYEAFLALWVELEDKGSKLPR